jgi:hypothetical protein
MNTYVGNCAMLKPVRIHHVFPEVEGEGEGLDWQLYKENVENSIHPLKKLTQVPPIPLAQ